MPVVGEPEGEARGVDRGTVGAMEWISDYRKAVGGSAILSGLIVVVIQYVQGEVLIGSIVFAGAVVAAVLLVWWTRADGGGLHMSHAAAHAAAGDDDLIVYWRPG